MSFLVYVESSWPQTRTSFKVLKCLLEIWYCFNFGKSLHHVAFRRFLTNHLVLKLMIGFFSIFVNVANSVILIF